MSDGAKVARGEIIPPSASQTPPFTHDTPKIRAAGDGFLAGGMRASAQRIAGKGEGKEVLLERI
jgi:hypothetical protein